MRASPPEKLEAPQSPVAGQSVPKPRSAGEVLASTRSRTCAARHFKVLNLKQSVKRAEKSPEKAVISGRLPGGVLEEVSRSSERKAAPVKDLREVEAMSESPRSVPKRTPRQTVPPELQRLPRPTLPNPARRKTIAFTTQSSPRLSTPSLNVSHAPRISPRVVPKRQSLGSQSERFSIGALRPGPLGFQGAVVPSWARTEAGLSPSKKLLAHSAATSLQRAFRIWWFRKFSSSGPRGFQALRDAVIYLQRWWRSTHRRRQRHIELKKTWKKMAIRMLLRDDAALVLQSFWQMVQVRYWLRGVRWAVRLIQAAWRRVMLVVHTSQKKYGMAKLFSWHRRWSARAQLITGIRKFHLIQYEAARSIQSLWRGRRTRHAFEESRDRLERARERREIIRRKAQLCDVRALKKTERRREEDVKAPAVAAVQPRSRRLSYGQSRLDASPRGSHQARLNGTVSMTAFPSSLTSNRTPAPQSLIRDLTSRGCLSSMPRASPFSQLLGHSDLDAVTNWLSGASKSLASESFQEHFHRGRSFKSCAWSVVVRRQPLTVA